MSETPDNTVVYAIGDVHGCDDLLRALLQEIARDAATRSAARRVIVYLGDYVDRGPDSRAVIDQVIGSAQQDFELVTLKGNHEALMLGFLDGEPEESWCWLGNGGHETLRSYGVTPPRSLNDTAGILRSRRDLLAALPASHAAFLRELSPSHQEGGYLFVHAGINPLVPLDAQAEDDLLWIRRSFLDWGAPFGPVVVHGHTISRRPDIRSNRIGIDTGAFATGVLTALVLSGSDQSFIQTRAGPPAHPTTQGGREP